MASEAIKDVGTLPKGRAREDGEEARTEARSADGRARSISGGISEDGRARREDER